MAVTGLGCGNLGAPTSKTCQMRVTSTLEMDRDKCENSEMAW